MFTEQRRKNRPKTSPGMVQVWTAAKGSVDTVNAGPSVPSTQSKGAPAGSRDGWPPLQALLAAGRLATDAAAPPTSPPRTAAPGAPTTQVLIKGSQAREGPTGRR